MFPVLSVTTEAFCGLKGVEVVKTGWIHGAATFTHIRKQIKVYSRDQVSLVQEPNREGLNRPLNFMVFCVNHRLACVEFCDFALQGNITT